MEDYTGLIPLLIWVVPCLIWVIWVFILSPIFGWFRKQWRCFWRNKRTKSFFKDEINNKI